jgi:hypothetical protein
MCNIRMSMLNLTTIITFVIISFMQSCTRIVFRLAYSIAMHCFEENNWTFSHFIMCRQGRPLQSVEQWYEMCVCVFKFSTCYWLNCTWRPTWFTSDSHTHTRWSISRWIKLFPRVTISLYVRVCARETPATGHVMCVCACFISLVWPWWLLEQLTSPLASSHQLSRYTQFIYSFTFMSSLVTKYATEAQNCCIYQLNYAHSIFGFIFISIYSFFAYAYTFNF